MGGDACDRTGVLILMKSVLALVGLLLVISLNVGCPSAGPVPGSGLTLATFQITEEVRMACPGATDEMILAIAAPAIEGRAGGASRDMVVDAFVDGCEDSPNVGVTLSLEDCTACGTAVIDAAFEQ